MAIQVSVVIRWKKETLVGKWEMFKDISPHTQQDWYLSGDRDKRGTDWIQPSQWFVVHFWIPELNAPWTLLCPYKFSALPTNPEV